MGPKKRKAAQRNAPVVNPPQPNSLDWMRDALECPVCLEDIKDPPIYICENPQGHSLCSKCHETLVREKKPCPVCREPLAKRRNLLAESIVSNIPNKMTCQFNGCDFKRSDGAAVRKHEEEECENRYVPCAYCDDKVGMKHLAQHITGEHGIIELRGVGKRGGGRIPLNCRKQYVMKNEADEQNPKFLFNWYNMDAITYMFWISFIGPKPSAKNIKYTFKVRKSSETNEYLLKSTKRCVPCDLSHDKVKSTFCAVILDQELIEDAKHKDGDTYKIYYDLIIHE